MSAGWIKLHRSLTEWGWYKDPITKAVFIHLLLTANHAPGEWRGIKIEPGQLVTGRKKLADELGISEQNVKTALKHLQNSGEISQNLTSKVTSKVTSLATLITIEKWALYQTDADELTSKVTSELTKHQPSTNQALTTNKNNKNKEEKDIKREIRENSITALSKEHDAYKAIKEKLKGGCI